jgi:hypothetical protein
MRESGERRRKARKERERERERALYRGSEGSASAPVRRRYYNCSVSAHWRGVFPRKFLHGMGHEADGRARVILVTRYTKTIFDAGYSDLVPLPRAKPGQASSILQSVSSSRTVQIKPDQPRRAENRPLPIMILVGLGKRGPPLRSRSHTPGGREAFCADQIWG